MESAANSVFCGPDAVRVSNPRYQQLARHRFEVLSNASSFKSTARLRRFDRRDGLLLLLMGFTRVRT
jgi:hypothetical protein